MPHVTKPGRVSTEPGLVQSQWSPSISSRDLLIDAFCLAISDAYCATVASPVSVVVVSLGVGVAVAACDFTATAAACFSPPHPASAVNANSAAPNPARRRAPEVIMRKP